MKTAEEWHHTEKYIKAQKAANEFWKCHCASCDHLRNVQADVLNFAAEIAGTHCQNYIATCETLRNLAQRV